MSAHPWHPEQALLMLPYLGNKVRSDDSIKLFSILSHPISSAYFIHDWISYMWLPPPLYLHTVSNKRWWIPRLLLYATQVGNACM